MLGHTTRRGFLCRTATAGGFLVTRGFSRAQQAARPVAGADAPSTAENFPITVVTEPVSRDVNARASAWIYIKEILQHAGLFFHQILPSGLPSLLHHSNPGRAKNAACTFFAFWGS